MSTRLTGFQSSRNDIPSWLPTAFVAADEGAGAGAGAGVEVVLVLIIEANHGLEVAPYLPSGAGPERVQHFLDVKIVKGNCVVRVDAVVKEARGNEDALGDGRESGQEVIGR